MSLTIKEVFRKQGEAGRKWWVVAPTRGDKTTCFLLLRVGGKIHVFPQSYYYFCPDGVREEIIGFIREQGCQFEICTDGRWS